MSLSIVSRRPCRPQCQQTVALSSRKPVGHAWREGRCRCCHELFRAPLARFQSKCPPRSRAAAGSAPQGGGLMRCGVTVGAPALTFIAATVGAQDGGIRAEVFFGAGGFVVDEKVYSFDVGATAWLSERWRLELVLQLGGRVGGPTAGCCPTRRSGISVGCGAVAPSTWPRGRDSSTAATSPCGSCSFRTPMSCTAGRRPGTGSSGFESGRASSATGSTAWSCSGSRLTDVVGQRGCSEETRDHCRRHGARARGLDDRGGATRLLLPGAHGAVGFRARGHARVGADVGRWHPLHPAGGARH